MSILVLLLNAAFGAAMPTTIVPGDGSLFAGECPAAHAEAEPRIRNLLTTPFLAELRARFDLGSATADHVELLTTNRDVAVCRALWQAVHTSGTRLSSGDSVSFYRSGDRFFVPIKRVPPPAPGATMRLDGESSVDVYDSAFRLVGRFAA